MNRRTTIILAIIVVILIAVFAITQWQRTAATKKLLADLPGGDYSKVMDAMAQLKERGPGLTPELLALLQSGAAPARWRAVSLLGEVCTPAAWSQLETALSDESPCVRAAAAIALGKLGAEAATPALIRNLTAKDGELEVRIAAARALGLLEAQSAAGPLAHVLADIDEAHAAHAAAAAKAAFDAGTALETAQEAEEEAREAADEEGDEETEEAYETAQTATEDAVEALAEAEDKADVAAAMSDAARAAADEATTAAEEAAAKAKEAEEAEASAEPADEETGDEDEADEEDEYEAPTDTSRDLRVACARALGMIGDAQSIDVLANAMNADKEPQAEVRVATAYALADVARHAHQEAPATSLTTHLIAALEDEIGDVRAAAIFSLSRVDIPESIMPQTEDALLKSCSDDFYWSREAARKTMKTLNMAVPEH